MTDARYNVTAMGAYIPEKRLTNFDLERMVETNDEWIVKRTGIHERAIAAENEFASDLAIGAVQEMLDNNPVTLEGVDMVLVTSFVPDHLTPSIAALVQGHFGIQGAGTFDLHAACTGFVYALSTASALLTSGQCRKILLIAAEVPTKAVDFTDRNTCILFGDAAVAMLLEQSDTPRIFASCFDTDGSVADMVYCSNVSTTVNATAVTKDRQIVQNGRLLYEHVVKNVPLGIAKLLGKADFRAEDIEWFVPHSANLRMIDTICDRAGIPMEKTLTSIEHYGNTSSASIPLALYLAMKDGRLKRGDKLVLYGFGGGVTHAGVIMEW